MWDQEELAVIVLFQDVLAWIVRLPVVVYQALEHIILELGVLVPDGGHVLVKSSALGPQLVAFQLHHLNLLLQSLKHFHLPLAAVLGGNLVLAPSPYVPDQLELAVGEVVVLNQLVEALHW